MANAFDDFSDLNSEAEAVGNSIAKAVPEGKLSSSQKLEKLIREHNNAVKNSGQDFEEFVFSNGKKVFYRNDQELADIASKFQANIDGIKEWRQKKVSESPTKNSYLKYELGPEATQRAYVEEILSEKPKVKSYMTKKLDDVEEAAEAIKAKANPEAKPNVNEAAEQTADAATKAKPKPFYGDRRKRKLSLNAGRNELRNINEALKDGSLSEEEIKGLNVLKARLEKQLSQTVKSGRGMSAARKAGSEVAPETLRKMASSENDVLTTVAKSKGTRALNAVKHPGRTVFKAAARHPVLAGITALGAAGYGAKKLYDALDDYDYEDDEERVRRRRRSGENYSNEDRAYMSNYRATHRRK